MVDLMVVYLAYLLVEMKVVMLVESMVEKTDSDLVASMDN